MAIVLIPCPSANFEIRGKVKVVKRGFPTGPEAEQAAIAEALAGARRHAANARLGCRCRGTCGLSFRPDRVRIGASGSQNNPAFEIVGAAIAYWTIYPICSKPPMPAPPPPPPPSPQPPDIDPVTTPMLPVTTNQSPYPFSRELPCGRVTVRISHGVPGEKEGGIIFEFERRQSERCNCEAFGWIQHVQRGTGNEWHYDNAAWHTYPNGSGIGAFSDPTQPVQPTNGTGKKNPWYGASSDPNPPADFAQRPTPQIKIGDKPSEQITSFVTQFVCVATGQVLFTWYWGPVLDENQPLENVPAGPTRQP